MRKTVGVVSLGCAKNRIDTEQMLGLLREGGWEITPDPADASVIIVNTCGFIDPAKQESIDAILEMAQYKSTGACRLLVATGCLVQRYSEALQEQMPEVDLLMGVSDYPRICELIDRALNGARPVACSVSRDVFEAPRVLTTAPFSAFVRTGDGCDNRCAYCAIPLIRGGLRSRRMETLVEEAQMLARAGVKELVLVAQDVTAYGMDLYGEARLPELLEALCAIDGLRWIRLLYCYPQRIDDRLLQVMRDQDKIVKYMDIPLQHVSQSVLRRMNRTGDAASLAQLIAHIRDMVPNIVLRTTMMTGFPGETEADFEELCTFVKDVKIERLGCFAFSTEEGTAAAEMPDQVPQKVRERRRDIVMEEQTRVADAYNQTQIGRTLDVLVESFDRYAECWFGRSAGDAPDIDGKVFFTCPKEAHVKAGDFVRVHITDTMDWDLMGEYVQ